METMSFKALSMQHLQGNHYGNQMETMSFLASEPMETASFWRAFYLEADRIYQQHRPGPDAWQKHQKHLKNADTLLFLELSDKAAIEFKLALSALQQPAIQPKEQQK